MDYKNLSFLEDEKKEIKSLHIIKDGKEEKLSIDEIFDNCKFNHFIGVTFSISAAFINSYLKDFKTCEIVIGIDNEGLKDSINKLAKNLKQRIFDQVRGDPIKLYQDLDLRMKNKIYEKKLKIWVSASHIIHSKFYLLWNDENETRLILGSANLSKAAFDERSKQFENILIFDNSNLFDLYKSYYEKNLSQVLCDYFPKELKKINAKNFKNIKNIDEIDLDEVFIISNEDIGKIKAQGAENLIDNLKEKISLGICEDKIITEIDKIETDRDFVKNKRRKDQRDEEIAYEIVHESINKRKKKAELKSSPSLKKQVKKKIEKIHVKSFEDDKDFVRYKLYSKVDLRNTKNDKTGLFVESDLDKNRLINFGQKIKKEDLTKSLKVLNAYLKGFEKYSNNYSDDYGKKVFESILCAFTAPFIYELRSRIDIEENRLDIPQFVIIGGEAGSGKSSLLAIMSKLTAINRGSYYQWDNLLGQSQNKAKRERLNRIENWILENNVNPILIDEIDSQFFTNTTYGRDFIVNISNLCVRRDDPYPVFIGTTNVKSYALPKEARRRSYYLIIDRQIKKTSESKDFYKKIYKDIDHNLFLEFSFRMAQRLEDFSSYKWDVYQENSGFDFLYNSREIFKEIYEDVDMPLPRYFPEKKYNDDVENNRDNWRKLYLGSKEDFVYDKTTGHIFYNIRKL